MSVTIREEQAAKEHIKQAFGVVNALAMAIRDRGCVASDTLYAIVSDRVSIEDYQRAIRTLERAAVIERTQTDYLRWLGN